LGNSGERRKILERLSLCVPLNSDWHRRLTSQLHAKNIGVGVHLAIFVEPYLRAILEGKKTIESRFAVTRRPPYECVEPDDYILLKRSGGPVTGLAVAKSTRFYELSPQVLTELRRNFARQLFAQDDGFWEARADKQYATLIELEDPVAIEPLPIEKRDRQGWVTYDRRSLRETAQLDI
jgi:hypothetical protein